MSRCRSLVWFVLALLSVGAAHAGSWESAFWAKRLLGQETWSRVVHVENAAPTYRYPAEFHALIFEFEGILWFYTETEGTQSLSQKFGQLGADKQNIPALVRALHPGFGDVVDTTGNEPPLNLLRNNKLPRGCFLYCLLDWRRLEQVSQPRHGQLLTYYVNSPEGPVGHTILFYQYGKKHYLYDPADTEVERLLLAPPPRDPLEAAHVFARKTSAGDPISAVLLDVHRTGTRVKEPVFRKRGIEPSVVVSTTP